MKKFGKKVQLEVQQKRQKEKKEMLDQVKKFRKGQTDTIDFLDDDGLPKSQGKAGSGRIQEKRKAKDKKFGFGGKKKGLKANTRESVNDVSGYRKPKKKPGAKNGRNRPGKSKRMKIKSNKK